jgi:uncharacterized membrane protein YhdT
VLETAVKATAIALRPGHGESFTPGTSLIIEGDSSTYRRWLPLNNVALCRNNCLVFLYLRWSISGAGGWPLWFGVYDYKLPLLKDQLCVFMCVCVCVRERERERERERVFFCQKHLSNIWEVYVFTYFLSYFWRKAYLHRNFLKEKVLQSTLVGIRTKNLQKDTAVKLYSNVEIL